MASTAWQQYSLDDDSLVRQIVEKMTSGVTARKFHSPSHSPTFLTHHQLEDVIKPTILGASSVRTALHRFRAIPGVADYMRTMKCEQHRAMFRKQALNYLSIYQPNCKFVVGSTLQYDRLHSQAAIVAHKDIKQGETIRYLQGISVMIDEATLDQLISMGRAVSVIDSARFGSSFLMLGTTRLVNHDCKPNSRLVGSSRRIRGVTANSVVAVRNIPPGDEITVYYGENYFGPRNIDCLCKTCEGGRVNGWSRRLSLDTGSEECVVLESGSEEEGSKKDGASTRFLERMNIPTSHISFRGSPLDPLTKGDPFWPFSTQPIRHRFLPAWH